MNDAVHAHGLTVWEVREQTTGSVFTHPRPHSCGHTLPNAHSHARALVRTRGSACARQHAHAHAHTHAHLRGPELQHHGPGLHVLRHARLLQVQQVALQPAAPLGPCGQPGRGQQLPQATFDSARVVLIACGARAQRVGVRDLLPPPPSPGPPSHEAKGLLGVTLRG